MNTQRLNPSNLWIGDAAAIGVVTLIGFGFHGGIQTADVNRIFALLIPYIMFWILIGIPIGVFKSENAARLNQLWRIALTVILATPLAAWLRAIWLNTAVVPIFVVVLTATGALGLILWRTAYIFRLNRIRKPSNE